MPPPDNRRPDSIETIAQALRPVLRSGVRAGRLGAYPDLLALDCVRAQAQDPTDPDSLAYGLEAVLLGALDALGDGPWGRAARLLFATVPDTRGRPLKERRRLAAYELDLLPSTFRDNYESELLIDVAAEIARPPRRRNRWSSWSEPEQVTP